MTVRVDRPPKAPRLTGDARRDLSVMQTYTRSLSRWADQMWQRTGATTDTVAATTTTANTAANTAAANSAGAVVPAPGGAVQLNPADPLDYAELDSTTATITVQAHTRTGAASPLVEGNVSPDVARGATYYVYYADAGGAGGAQTYLANTDLAVVLATVGYRLIGSIYVEPQSYGDRMVD